MMRVGGPFSPKENWVYVVRCKDCKYWFSSHGEYGVCEYHRQKEEMPIRVDADDFCSRGEKK